MPEEKLHNLQPYESRDGAWGLVNKMTGVSVDSKLLNDHLCVIAVFRYLVLHARASVHF